MKGMALKNLLDRYRKRRKDAGVGLVDALIGLGLAAIIIGVPVLYFTTVSTTAAGNASIQNQNTAISEALDRTVANIQASDTILHAGPDELVVRSTEVEAGQPDKPVVTRWVVNGATLYRQTWIGAGTGPTEAAAYNRSTPVTDSAVTATVVKDLKLTAGLFSYTDKDGAGLDVAVPSSPLTETARTSPADGKTTYDIALVNIALTAGTSVNGTGKTGTVEAKTSAAPRSVSGKAVDAAITATDCPAVTVTTDGSGKPVVTWKTLPGYTSYQISRNSVKAATVGTAAVEAQKTWTDSGFAPSPAEEVQYRVLALDSAGAVASLACTPKTWAAQIQAPVFKNSAVLPDAAEARDWTDGPDGSLALKKPLIVIRWDAVPGVTGYELKYRELDAATGNPLTTGFAVAAPELSPTATSFTWDEGGWGRSYEWFIKANAGSGKAQSAESARITTLTHPPAPQNVDVAPEYGTDADRLTMGVNVITWSGVPNATKYAVWKYNNGSTGAVTLLATVDGSVRTYSDKAPYGTTTTYYVAALNNGPRGNTSGEASSANPEAGVTAATGVMPVSYRAPASTGPVFTTATYRGVQAPLMQPAVSTPVDPAPKPVSQLQYPPVPDVADVSAAAGQTRDLDGANRIVWAPTLSATGYQVAKFSLGGAKTCLTDVCGTAPSGGTTETSLTDPAAKGTQQDYAVKAVNPTGVSVDFSAKVRLTQRPAAPAMTTVRIPSLQDRTADFTVVQNADAGNTGAERFCTPETCEYQLTKNGLAVATYDHTQSGTQMPFSRADSPDGSTTTFTAKSRNSAITNSGYSDPAVQTVKTYPGAFGVNQWLGDRYGNARERFIVDLVSADVIGSSSTNGTAGKTTVAWGPSAGASSMEMERIPVANERTSTNTSLGLPFPGGVDVTFGAGSNLWSGWAAPGATYRHTLVAKAANGLTRTVTTGNIVTPADLPYHAKVIVTCSNDTWSNQTTAKYNHPDHYIGARMIDMNRAPLYGAWGGTSIWGLESRKGQANFTLTNGVWLEKWQGNPNTNAGPGNPYYYGVTSGFDIQNAGFGGPASARLRLTMTALATFNDGCGPYHGTWNQLSEPTWACYGYVPGQPCQTNSPWNRPQWRTK